MVYHYGLSAFLSWETFRQVPLNLKMILYKENNNVTELLKLMYCSVLSIILMPCQARCCACIYRYLASYSIIENNFSLS